MEIKLFLPVLLTLILLNSCGGPSAISPDGKQKAYVVTKPTFPTEVIEELWIANSDGTNKRLLGPIPSNDEPVRVLKWLSDHAIGMLVGRDAKTLHFHFCDLNGPGAGEAIRLPFRSGYRLGYVRHFHTVRQRAEIYFLGTLSHSEYRDVPVIASTRMLLYQKIPAIYQQFYPMKPGIKLGELEVRVFYPDPDKRFSVTESGIEFRGLDGKQYFASLDALPLKSGRTFVVDQKTKQRVLYPQRKVVIRIPEALTEP